MKNFFIALIAIIILFTHPALGQDTTVNGDIENKKKQNSSWTMYPPMPDANDTLQRLYNKSIRALLRRNAQGISGFSWPILDEKGNTIKSLTEKSDQNDAISQYILCDIYFGGEQSLEDQEKGIKYLTLSATNGFAPAQTTLGTMNSKGIGVQKDTAKALKWFRYAAAQKDPMGQIALGSRYLFGKGVNKNPELGLELFKTAANQGDPRAQIYLATIYMFDARYSLGIGPNLPRAYQWTITSLMQLKKNQSSMTDDDLQTYSQAQKIKSVLEEKLSEAHIRISSKAAIDWMNKHYIKTQ